jgi:hypothetical protein
LGHRDWVVAVGVEWAERSQPADTHADNWPGRRSPRGAADQAAGRGGLPAADEIVGRDVSVVLTDPERRMAEYRRYVDIVHRALGPARDADPPGQDRPPDADAPARPTARDTPASTWAEAVAELRATWEQIKVKYDYAERRGPTPQPADGSWEGEGGQRLDAAQNADIDRGYARIREAGQRAVIPRLRAVEAEDPTRHLAGFEHCFKGPDRLKEKVANLLEPPSRLTAVDALQAVSDTVRFTYTYQEDGYVQGVPDDVARLKVRGFELDKLKNTWTNDQYKGINTQWLDPESGVRFEVQFHTQASLEAKELSHQAYERIRNITDPSVETDREAAELEAFQSKVNAMVPKSTGRERY